VLNKIIINGKKERGVKEAAALIKENFLNGVISAPQERTQKRHNKTADRCSWHICS
jgi:hypothetical protein